MSKDGIASSQNIERYVRPLADFFAQSAVKRLAADTVLFHEGEAPAAVYLLRSGVIDLVYRRSDGTERRRPSRAGEILGMPAVISGQPHLSSAVTRTACEIGFIERDVFRRLVSDHATIWFSVLRQLSQDLNDSYDVMRKGLTKGSS